MKNQHRFEMKKIIFCGLLFVFSAYSLYSQVGINAVSPEGALHIKSLTLPADNKGVLVGSDGSDGLSVSINDVEHPSASVSLGANNKAFIPNSVALVDARGNAAGNPIKNPVDGMVVYNTARGGEVPNNVIPGLYVFNSTLNKWMYCLTESSNRQTKIYTLYSELTLPTTKLYNSANGTAGFAPLNLVAVGASTPTNYIEVMSDAAYAMMLTLSGAIPSVSSFQKMTIYVAAVSLKSDGTVDKVLDIAEIDPTAFSQGSRTGGVTYPLTLGFDAHRGERISVRIASYEGTPSWTLKPGETSIVFFKI